MFVRPDSVRSILTTQTQQPAAAAQISRTNPWENDVYAPLPVRERSSMDRAVPKEITAQQVQGIARQPRLVRDILWGPLRNELHRAESKSLEFVLAPCGVGSLLQTLQSIPRSIADFKYQTEPRFAEQCKEDWCEVLNVRLPNGLKLHAPLLTNNEAFFKVDVRHVDSERDFRELAAFVESASQSLGANVKIDNRTRTLFYVNETTDYRLAWFSASASAT